MTDADRAHQSTLALVGDLGGTNARFGIVDLAGSTLESRNVLTVRCADFAGPEAAIENYLAQVSPERRPEVAVLAVAGPVTRGSVRFTNNPWACSEEGLRTSGFRAAKLLNDFEALAYAASRLQPNDARSLGGPASGLANGNLIVLGPGTGFGLSLLARTATTAIAVATESGHAAFAPNDALECEVLRLLMHKQQRVVVESILSGPGLLRLYVAICSIHHANPAADSAADVTALARSGDAMGKLTVERFCALLGSVAGDAAMGHGARGGVFITGGVADTLSDELQRGEFRARFEAKGQYADYVRAIPTALITRTHPALLGAAVVALALGQTGATPAH